LLNAKTMTQVYVLSLHDALPILTAILFRVRKPLPATCGVLGIGFFVTTGGFDLALFQAAAFFIGLVIQRRDDVFAKLGTLGQDRSEEHTSELQSRENLVCRLLLE